MIKALGYLAFRTDRIAEWGDYARGLLGLQLIDRGPGQLAFRMDDRCQRLMVVEEPGQPLAQVDRDRPAQIGAARFDQRQHLPLQHGTKAGDCGFDFRQLWHDKSA